MTVKDSGGGISPKAVTGSHSMVLDQDCPMRHHGSFLPQAVQRMQFGNHLKSVQHNGKGLSQHGDCYHHLMFVFSHGKARLIGAGGWGSTEQVLVGGEQVSCVALHLWNWQGRFPTHSLKDLEPPHQYEQALQLDNDISSKCEVGWVNLTHCAWSQVTLS